MKEITLPSQTKYVFVVFIFLFLAGCASSMDVKKNNRFEIRLRGFSQAIRWSNFEHAQQFIRLRETVEEPQDMAFLKTIKITRFRPIQEAFEEPIEESEKQDDEQNAVRILTYQIEYYPETSYNLKKLLYQQRWWYDEKEETWFLDSNLPQFK